MTGPVSFPVPPGWTRLTTIDAHAAGEPLRVITGGYPELPGRTMLEKRRVARERFDHLRRALMLEPRGHADMYGAILTAPVTPDGDVGVLFTHNEGYSTMCGHGIIALVKVILDCGLLPGAAGRSVVRIDTPAGRITARPHMRGDRVARVSFLNVPSFMLESDLEVEVDGLGRVRGTIAFGGAFYMYVDARPLGLDITPANYSRLIEAGMRIKRAVMARHPIAHPAGDPDLNFLYGTILYQDAAPPIHSRNVCVFADGEVDRSPTGTGVSGRAAMLHAQGALKVGETITIESLIGTTFDVRVAEVTRVGRLPAVVPEVTGEAYLTGRHEFLIDPDDPLRDGVLLR
jgi:trans-L-3-hydroxyproline dehydratase